MATVHSNSTRSVKNRLSSLCLKDNTSSSYDFVKLLIDEAIDTAIQIEIVEGKRIITNIYDIKEDKDLYIYK